MVGQENQNHSHLSLLYRVNARVPATGPHGCSQSLDASADGPHGQNARVQIQGGVGGRARTTTKQ